MATAYEHHRPHALLDWKEDMQPIDAAEVPEIDYSDISLDYAFHLRATHHQIPIDDGDSWGVGINFTNFIDWMKRYDYSHYLQDDVVLYDWEVKEMLDEYFLNYALPGIESPDRPFFLKFHTFRSVCKSYHYPHSFTLFREYLAWTATQDLKGVNRWKRMCRFFDTFL